MARAPATRARQAARHQLGRRVMLLRERADLTQDQLARKVGVSRQTLLSWEAGASEPLALDLARLAEVVGASVAALLGLEPVTLE